MSDFSYPDWLRHLLDHGEAVFKLPPVLPKSTSEESAILQNAHCTYSLQLAGPMVPFSANIASLAGRVVLEASWAFLNPSPDHYNNLTALQSFRKLRPTSPGDHLSADLVLRFLVTVYRRALLRDSESALTTDLREIFLDWPLTGLLADLEEPPHRDLNFYEHPGLQLLYAERFVRNARANWMPRVGTIRERVELVFQGLGRELPLLDDHGL